jgi:FtsP/CotA-like multicopper oxidase with cupredoxin domain
MIDILFSYSYRFVADVPGTHWYHGHLGSDRSEGLLGSLIILAKDATQTGVGGQNPPGREYVALLQVKIIAKLSVFIALATNSHQLAKFYLARSYCQMVLWA